MAIVKDNKKYIVQSAKDMGDFVQVKLKGEESILIPLEDYFMMAIKLNSSLPKEVVDKYKMYQEVYQSFIRVKYRISLKDQTLYEIKNYCRKNLKLDEIMTDTVLDMISKTNLVDDHAYALNKASYYQDTGFSVNEIRNKLRKVGIKEAWIEEGVSSLSTEKEEVNAFKQAEKLVHTIKGKSAAQTKMILTQKLIQKGFSYDVSNRVVDSFDIKEDDSALLLTYNKAKRLYTKEAGYKRLEKIRSYCVRKGFSLSQVNEIMEGEEE